MRLYDSISGGSPPQLDQMDREVLEELDADEPELTAEEIDELVGEENV